MWLGCDSVCLPAPFACRFYEYAFDSIGCKAADVIFLDDIGLNLKAARKLGVHTILVKNTTPTSFHAALRELQDVTGVSLLDTAEPSKL
jgi:FMN phosphatase YigB (HAD superfamily)